MDHFHVKGGGGGGEGGISRDTCSIGNHLLEESKKKKKTVTRLSLLQAFPAGSGEGGGGVEDSG